MLFELDQSAIANQYKNIGLIVYASLYLTMKYGFGDILIIIKYICKIYDKKTKTEHNQLSLY